ncbi:NAD(P)-binding protein [Pseudomonas synxantha]|nr:NAD(P)-binding protein [Pseudomonas synxantha]
MSNGFKAIIAGGGFGGLTAATALAQRGWSVTVFEREHELRAAGSGIYIWENGLRILDAVGAKVVSQDSFHGRAMEQRDRHNKVIDQETSRLRCAWSQWRAKTCSAACATRPCVRG